MKLLITLYKKLKTVINRPSRAPFTDLEKLRVLNIGSQLNVSTRREPKKKLKQHKYSSTLTILLIMQYLNMVTSSNG